MNIWLALSLAFTVGLVNAIAGYAAGYIHGREDKTESKRKP